MDHLVPVAPQCQTRASDIVKLIILDILSGRQALVHLEQWAHDIDWPKRIRLGLVPSWFNDDAIARHLDRLYEANIHQVLSSCLVQIDKKEGLLFASSTPMRRTKPFTARMNRGVGTIAA
nr:DUF4277 domain-containing protein [Geobacillus subterraneus]